MLKVEDFARSDCWFADGNIVLVAGHAAFKVHRGQLERHSEVFRDLFMIPQPADQDMIDGCYWVELHDSPTDVLYLLRALYDGLYFKKPYADSFPALAGVLRLSAKYVIDHLQAQCLLHLESDWPSTLPDWDIREKRATEPSGRYNPRDACPHPILVIKLALELGLDNLLASAFYDLSRYGPRKIVSGAPLYPLILPPPLTSSAPFEEPTDGPILTHLARPHLHTTLLGREAAQRYLSTFIDTELTSRPISVDCVNRHHDGGRVCRESFYFIMLNLLRSVGGIACGRDADPLHTFVQAIEMLSRTDFSDGVRQCGLKICDACKGDFSESVKKAREDVWKQIPGWFRL